MKVDRNLAATFAESAFPIRVVVSETFVLFWKCIIKSKLNTKKLTSPQLKRFLSFSSVAQEVQIEGNHSALSIAAALSSPQAIEIGSYFLFFGR